MATFAAVVSDPETGHSYQFEIDGQDANRFIGREIGDELDGDAVGLDDHTIEISGGSDSAGRPMRDDLSGSELNSVLLEGGPGFDPAREGERRRVSVRGREVSDEITQLNLAVTSQGDTHVDAILGEGELVPDENGEAEAAAADDAQDADDE